MNRLAPTLAAAAAVLALGLGAGGAAQAAPSATVVIHAGPQAMHPAYGVQTAPPPPRYERVPGPRRGMVWSQGHWEWRGHRYQWVPGQWVRVRHGHHYRQPRWEQRNGHWRFNQGRWDSDRDGVPNRYDRRPHNPHRH